MGIIYLTPLTVWARILVMERTCYACNKAVYVDEPTRLLHKRCADESAATISSAMTDAEIREAIRLFKAELLRRQRERATQKYLATAGGR
jgi:hypothetical protein